MKTKIGRWGNSMGLRLPKFIVEQLKINIDNEVELSIKDGALIIKKKSDLDKMLDKITPENIHFEMFVDNPVGKEIW